MIDGGFVLAISWNVLKLYALTINVAHLLYYAVLLYIPLSIYLRCYPFLRLKTMI